jgi:hypothetical protein
MLPVADREVVQRHHGAISAEAQATASQSSATAGSTASTRRQAGQARMLRRREPCGKKGGGEAGKGSRLYKQVGREVIKATRLR